MSARANTDRLPARCCVDGLLYRPALDEVRDCCGRGAQEQTNALYGPLCKLESRGSLAGTSPPSGASYLGDDGIPQNRSWFTRRMWAMPRGLCLLRALAELDDEQSEKES